MRTANDGNSAFFLVEFGQSVGECGVFSVAGYEYQILVVGHLSFRVALPVERGVVNFVAKPASPSRHRLGHDTGVLLGGEIVL